MACWNGPRTAHNRGNADGESGIPNPDWLTAAINEWAQISGTTPPTELGDYSGVGWRDYGATMECFAALSGGHNGNNSTNRAMALDLTANAPAWAQVKASGSFSGYDGEVSGYLVDGSPGPRHLYTGIIWWQERGAYLMGGNAWANSGNGNWLTNDGYIRDSNTWEAAGTYASRQNALDGNTFFSIRDPATGTIYLTGDSSAAGGKKITTSALTTLASWYSTGGAATSIGGGAFDTSRNVVFQLFSGSYRVTGDTSTIALTISTGGTKTAISFNSSAAWTQWQANVAKFLSPWLVYDAGRDCYYWYNGNAGNVTGEAGTIYKITPNGTSTWDMSLISPGGVSPVAHSTGTLNRFYYASRWNALLLVVPGQNVYYMRIA